MRWSRSFNSRPHEEVDWNFAGGIKRNEIFQFTTSRGGRPSLIGERIGSKIFQFTTSRGGRLSRGGWGDDRVLFQFTTSRGGRLNRCKGCSNSTSFNSRPHEEVDCHSFLTIEVIKCFQFTTSRGGRRRVSVYTSPGISFNSRPHEEVDFLPGWQPGSFLSFNSRPHEEVDSMPVPSNPGF